ncbi:MAG: HD domain-containing protein, partial [Synergistetes bacterium]|nr:HD domain-containing protein [Synergistota bacterium]
LAVAFNTCDTMENLWREAEELNILLEIIREGSKAKTLQELARIITTTIGRARDYENLSLFTKEGDKLVIQYSYYKEGHKPSPDTPLYGHTIGINQKSVIVRATKQGEMQNIPDTSKEPEYLCGYECFNSELAVPIKAGDEVIAVLNTESKKLNAFDTQEELFLSLAAEESAGMIQNIKLQEDLKAKNEELMMTVQELTEKESKLSSTIEQIESYTKEIEETNRKLSQKEEQLKRTYMQTIKALSELIEIKDPYTRGHSLRVAKWSVRIAKEMGISEPYLQRIFLAGLLHDIGKIGVRGAVLNKAGKLTEEEYDEIKKHPVIGANILREVKHLQDIVPVILHHHERWDGRGYPDGLKGTGIPLWSRIMAVADTLDAMTSSRPYRKALSMEDAVEEIKRNAGRQFDPDVVEAFLKIIIESKDIPK